MGVSPLEVCVKMIGRFDRSTFRVANRWDGRAWRFCAHLLKLQPPQAHWSLWIQRVAMINIHAIVTMAGKDVYHF
jgi:hypothetical protein